MSAPQQYQREKNGIRFSMGGMNTVLPPDLMPPGKAPYYQNVRAYLQGRTKGRATQTGPVQTIGAAVHSLRRLNDSTPLGPPSGFALIAGGGTELYLNSTGVATGMSGNPVAMIPFRPNASPQPWMFIGDSSLSTVIAASNFPATGMLKVRSDGLTYKMGVKEPQNSPLVSTETVSVGGNVTVLGTARPWSNVSPTNPSFNYGDNGDGTGSVVISTPTAGAQLTVTASGTAVINGATVGPGDIGPAGASNPGQFVSGTPNYLLGAWTDNTGAIVSGTGAGVITIGTGSVLTVPAGATQLQLGMDGIGGNFSGNTGSFAVAYTLTTSAVATVVSLQGDVTAYYWGDSPHTGPVAAYIWKNAGDTAGSGPIRDISDAAGSTTNNSLIFDSTVGSEATPMEWTVLDSTGAPTGTKPVFQPALETEGYADWNMCVVGNLFIPGPGTYTFTALSKDNVMWGIGSNATWPGIHTITGALGQTETVVSKCPLLPSPTINGSGAATSVTVDVTFPGAGLYPIECDYDYWDKTGRTLVITVNGQTIPPLTGNVKSGVQYRYTYRSSLTGATSNPSPESLAQQVPSIANTVVGQWSNDPQVDKIDFYRVDEGLDNFTYVGTVDNTNPPTKFTDQLLDASVEDNPLLQFDNYEPFPSIDLPKGGTVNVIGGITQWVSGDLFNIRWLAGTVINIGGLDYTLYNRPSSPTNLIAIDVPDGSNLTYEIAEPILAAQPLASLWGDTDNTAFVFGCGDNLRPGTLYWCKGNNLDSAPDTNQQDVTSPSEPLINGVIANGIGMVFSTENGWVIYPNFTSALATVTGTAGSAFSLIRSSVTRGLYIRPCICTDGSGTFFYRSKDGIEMCSGTAQQKSLTDTDLFNIFPHEGFAPVPVLVAGFTVYPPDDNFPEQQRMRFATGYLYYDYQNIIGTRSTLVFDVAGGGWVADVYEWPATLHCLEEGPDVNGVLVGCSNGTIRNLSSAGIEFSGCVVTTAANNGGDARSEMTVGDIYMRAFVDTNSMVVNPYTNQLQTPVLSSGGMILAQGISLQSYIIDFPAGAGAIVNDIGLLIAWQNDPNSYLDLWQPDWTELPEDTQDRPTDWSDLGNPSSMFIQGFTLEADTFNAPKVIAVQSGDDLTLHVPDQSPVTFDGQSKQDLTFTPPFVAHSIRIVTTDHVPWRMWPSSMDPGAWAMQPFPASVPEWQTELNSLGGTGWQHIREMNIAHISTADLVLTLTFDIGASPTILSIVIPNSGGGQAKTKVTIPRNKFKLVAFRLSSTAPFRHFKEDMECKIGDWGRTDPYRNIKPFGGPSSTGATL